MLMVAKFWAFLEDPLDAACLLNLGLTSVIDFVPPS
jgi:hypothetical protein